MDNYEIVSYIILAAYTLIGVMDAWSFGWQWAVIPVSISMLLAYISIMRGSND